jgi:hypothetical protein
MFQPTRTAAPGRVDLARLGGLHGCAEQAAEHGQDNRTCAGCLCQRMAAPGRRGKSARQARGGKERREHARAAPRAVPQETREQ